MPFCGCTGPQAYLYYQSPTNLCIYFCLGDHSPIVDFNVHDQLVFGGFFYTYLGVNLTYLLASASCIGHLSAIHLLYHFLVINTAFLHRSINTCYFYKLVNNYSPLTSLGQESSVYQWLMCHAPTFTVIIFKLFFYFICDYFCVLTFDFYSQFYCHHIGASKLKLQWQVLFMETQRSALLASSPEPEKWQLKLEAM